MVYIITIVAVVLVTIGMIITIVLIRRRKKSKIANSKNFHDDRLDTEHDLVKVTA